MDAVASGGNRESIGRAVLGHSRCLGIRGAWAFAVLGHSRCLGNRVSKNFLYMRLGAGDAWRQERKGRKGSRGVFGAIMGCVKGAFRLPIFSLLFYLLGRVRPL